VKTRLHVKFGGRRTLGDLAKIDPGAIWRVGLSFTADSEEFSHNLAALQTLKRDASSGWFGRAAVNQPQHRAFDSAPSHTGLQPKQNGRKQLLIR
jgi:hypothetical protein